MKRWIVWLIKLSVSVMLLSIVLITQDLATLWTVIKGTDHGLFCLAVFIGGAAFALNTKRWHLFAPPISYWRLFALNLVARYYSVVLPGQLSGDILKAWRLGKREHQLSNVAAGVFLDKAIAVASLFVITSLALVLNERFRVTLLELIYSHRGGIFIVIVSMLGVGYLIWRLWYLFERLLEKWLAGRFPSVRFRLGSGFLSKRVLNANIALSFVYHGLAVLLMRLAGESVNIQLPWTDWTWVYGFMSVFIMLPVSFAGIGVREASLVGCLSALGVSSEQAVALSFIHLAITLLLAFPGFLLEVTGADHRKVLQSQEGTVCHG